MFDDCFSDFSQLRLLWEEEGTKVYKEIYFLLYIHYTWTLRLKRVDKAMEPICIYKHTRDTNNSDNFQKAKIGQALTNLSLNINISLSTFQISLEGSENILSSFQTQSQIDACIQSENSK